MKNNRIGNIEILICVIDKEPWLARCIMSRVIVVQAEYLYMTNAIAYTVICDEFDENPEGCIAPDYNIQVSAEDGIVFRKTLKRGFPPRFVEMVCHDTA